MMYLINRNSDYTFSVMSWKDLGNGTSLVNKTMIDGKDTWATFELARAAQCRLFDQQARARRQANLKKSWNW